MLCGLLTPDEGRGTCLGYDIRTQADEIKRHVGYMTQRFSLYQDLSVRENLESVARLYGVSDPAAAARAMIERLGLEDRHPEHWETMQPVAHVLLPGLRAVRARAHVMGFYTILGSTLVKSRWLNW
jgi:ABC-type proline/glycine betaine transport system ATPase subunit